MRYELGLSKEYDVLEDAEVVVMRLKSPSDGVSLGVDWESGMDTPETMAIALRMLADRLERDNARNGRTAPGEIAPQSLVENNLPRVENG